MSDYKLNFYNGANYGLDPSYGNFLGFKNRYSTKDFALTTDPRSANQISEVSKKISTGTKVIEVSGVMPNILESIPQQHFDEIKRLKELTKVELTFHGPLVEPTGINPQGGNYSEDQRRGSELQMWSALQRANQLDPKGNIVVTFHSSNGLPSPKTLVKDEKGNVKEAQIFVVNEKTGQFGGLPPPTKDEFTGKEATTKEQLDGINKRNWEKALGELSFVVRRGKDAIDTTVEQFTKGQLPDGLTPEQILNIYQQSFTPDGQKYLDALSPEARKITESIINNMAFGQTHIKEAYTGFKQAFNEAYFAAVTEEDKKKLDDYKIEMAKTLENWSNDPAKVIELAEEVTKGVRLLSSVKTPQEYQPLEDFAIRKAADTFSNLAVRSFGKFGEHSPIISIENPPAGTGLTSADQLTKLVEASRDKFVEKARLSPKDGGLGLSHEKAKQEAEKLIGVTWDVGHINMIRKFGFTEDDVVKESKKIAPFTKHVHLSDNFGLEHTELPMGMGNVPMKQIMELHENFKKAKKVVETGGPWFQFFQRSPLKETFEAFGSPLYAMEKGPYWNQIASMSGGYSPGFGQTLPEQHFSMYGAGFSGLPQELGGQIPGNRSRVSGTPME